MHIGKEIKRVFSQTELSVDELGEMVGLKRSNVYNIFLRETIDTGLLEKLGTALQFDFFSLFSENHSDVTKTGSGVKITIQVEETNAEKVLKTVFGEDKGEEIFSNL